MTLSGFGRSPMADRHETYSISITCLVVSECYVSGDDIDLQQFNDKLKHNKMNFLGNQIAERTL